MKLLFVFGIIFVYMSCHSEAYIGVLQVPEDPEHPGQCLSAVYPETRKTYHDIGSTWKSAECESGECKRKDSRTLEITIRGCAPIAYPPTCVPVPLNSSKPFPQCCPTARCPEV